MYSLEVAFVGSNGEGKTTMIRILSTLIRPDQGSAQVCGFDVVRQSNQVREEISLTGQNAAVDGVLTAERTCV